MSPTRVTPALVLVPILASTVAAHAPAQGVWIGGHLVPAPLAPAPSPSSGPLGAMTCGVLAQCAIANSGPGATARDGNAVWQGNFFGSAVIEKLDPSTCGVLHTIPAPAPYIGGLAFDGTSLWACAEQSGQIFRLDPANGNVLSTIPAPGFGQPDPDSSGLAWDGQFLWHADYTFDTVYKLDPANGNVLASFPSPGPIPADLAYAAGVLVLADASTDTLDVIDPANGNVLSSCATPGSHPWGVEVTANGSTWSADLSASTLYEIDTALAAGPVVYCTAGTSSHGCVPAIGWSGTPSASAASGFTVAIANVEGQKQGLLFYGISGQLALNWGAGSTSFLCVKPPTQRMPVQPSGGTSGACDGSLSRDWLAYVAANPGALGVPFAAGNVVQVQGWYRDPPAVKTTNLSDGLEFTLEP
jgi:DNA-binding beta-propeller fold protein YncE